MKILRVQLTESGFMFSKIASITLPIVTLVLVGFLYSRRVKPDLGGANKLVVDVALPVLIFISLSAKSFDPISALSFTGASVVLIFLSRLIAWPLAKFSGATQQVFLPCAVFTNILHFTLGAGVMSGKVAEPGVYATRYLGRIHLILSIQTHKEHLS
jgi:predicted permease